MTNYERLFSDKRKLAEQLDKEFEFYNRANGYFCNNVCPHRSTCRGGEAHDCIDETSGVDIMLMWLDAEYAGED